MTGKHRKLKIVALALAGLVVVTFIAAIVVLRSAWFRDFVREKIVTAAEEATGGRVELAKFDLDLSDLRVRLTGFVLHGTEPANAAPLFRAESLEADVRLLLSGEIIDIQYLGVDRPSANIMVFPDGRTNIPTPKTKSPPSDKSGLETVVNLAVDKFEILDASVQFAQQKTGFSARGEKLAAQLLYNPASVTYEGALNIKPLTLTSGKNEPLHLDVSLPMTLGKDRIDLRKARIQSAKSTIDLNGTLERLADPLVSAQLQARVALEEVQRAADLPIDPAAKGAPSTAVIDVVARSEGQTMHLDRAHVTLGRTNLQASGVFKDPSQQGAVHFTGDLVLDELGRLLKVSAEPRGSIHIAGNTKLMGPSGYLVTGNVASRDLSVRQGNRRLNDIALATAFRVDPKIVAIKDLRLAAVGGEITADAVLEEFARLKLDGRLRNFSIQRMATTFANQPAGYDGTISGVVGVQGNLKAPKTSGIQAQARLKIDPARRGPGVTGDLQANYNGETETVVLGKSYIALPNSRLDVSGTLGERLDVIFRSTNLNDFQPAIAVASSQPSKELPVRLDGGAANLTAAVTGKLDAPRIAARVAVNRFSVDQHPFDELSADINASPSGVSLQNGIVAGPSLQARFDGSAGLENWKAVPAKPVHLNASIPNGELADLLALAGQKDIELRGTLIMNAQISGTIGSPKGGAQVSVVKGTAYQEPFERFDAKLSLADGRVDLAPVQLTAGSARVDLTGSFTHPKDSYETGRIELQVATNQVSIERFKKLVEKRPGLAGRIQANANAVADLNRKDGKAEVKIAAVNANLQGRDLRDGKERLGNVMAEAKTTGNNVDFRVNSDFIGSDIRISGRTGLAKDYPTTASLSIRNLEVERVLQAAQQAGLPVRGGSFSATGEVAGTLRDPRAKLSFRLDRAVVYDERLDRLEASVNYTNSLVEIPSFRLATPAGEIELNGSLAHPPNDFQNGQLKLRVNGGDLQLARLENLRKRRPGLTGALRIMADVSADLKKDAGKQQILFSKVDADIGTRDLALNEQPLGNASFRAQTKGRALSVQFDSDLADSAIHGSGEAQLEGDYPVNAKVSFGRVTYAGIRRVLGSAGGDVDGLAEGQVTISGPALKPDNMRGRVELSRLHVAAVPRGERETAPKRIALQNQGPIVVELAESEVNVRSFRMAGSGTDITLGGTAHFRDKKDLNLSAKGNANLALLQDLNASIYSSGALLVEAAVRGTMDRPRANGKIELKDASLNYTDSPNGLAHANGVILLSGNSATIQSLVGESGGGTISLSGFAGYGQNAVTYDVKAKADKVRSRYSGASVVMSANLNLKGTSQSSLVAGDVTIQKVSYTSRTDVGSGLRLSSGPPSSPSAPSGPLAGMKLDIRIKTAPDVRFQTTMAEQLQAIADLNLRGRIDSPGMSGQINVLRGEMVFFGNRYSVNRGVISFYNPLRIEPVLDIDLVTRAKGVDVVLGVSGPVDNMRLTYRSDPPLQFEEIVGLLATGKIPTSDPTLAAQQPAPPDQSLSQMGESAIIGTAVAAPLANRLERVFGVSQLKIDPTFAGGSQFPQARVTLQQQVADNVTFTYTTNLQEANSQILRVEWAFTPRFSAIATRDENGIVGVDFFYKKQFR